MRSAALRHQKWIAAGLCSFEVYAITTGRAPTLTQLSAQHRWVGPALVGALAVHLWRTPRMVVRPVADGDCALCPEPF